MATIYGTQGGDTPQRILLTSLLALSLAVGLWILYGGGALWVSAHTPLKLEPVDPVRKALLAGALTILLLRLCVTFFVLLSRRIPWPEALSIPGALALYFVGFPLFAAARPSPPDLLMAIAILLYVIGSITNTLSEVLRARWKRHPENKGKVYTGGLFRYAVHVNYFGDVLWVAGLAGLAGNPWGWLVPVMLFGFFKFFNAPMLDRHLSEHYGAEFDAYKARTASMIPFLW